MTATRYFLGSNTPAGFRDTVSGLYDPADGWRVYFLKGGPGTGKSTLLRRIAAQTDEAEVYLCSADPDSLDGVRLPQQRLLVVDATAPHAAEPQYWGSCERLVPLSSCVDNGRLYTERDRLRELSDRCRTHHIRARRQLSCAAVALNERDGLLRGAIDTAAIAAYAERLADKEFEPQTADENEERRVLCAFTPQGLVPLFETAQACCPRLFAVIDEGGVAPMLLSRLRRAALSAGLSTVVSYSVLFPDRIEQLLLPQIGTAFLTSHPQTPIDFPVYRRIHTTRFVDTETLREHRNKRTLLRRTADACLAEAAAEMQTAKTVHDELEQVYASATDWSAVEHMGNTLLQELFG